MPTTTGRGRWRTRSRRSTRRPFAACRSTARRSRGRASSRGSRRRSGWCSRGRTDHFQGVGMAGPFDATLKQLVDAFASDWVGVLAPLVGLPASVGVDPIDPDLSTVQPAADKVFRLRPPAAGLLHIEPQSSWDGDLPGRVLVYNVLL